MYTRRMRIDMDEFRKETTPRARKEHKCDLCRGVIEVGERYVHIVRSTDGEVFDDKYHIGCCCLIERYVKNMGGYVDPYEDDNVIDDIRDTVCCDCDHIAECGLKYRQIATCPNVVKRYLG